MVTSVIRIISILHFVSLCLRHLQTLNPERKNPRLPGLQPNTDIGGQLGCLLCQTLMLDPSTVAFTLQYFFLLLVLGSHFFALTEKTSLEKRLKGIQTAPDRRCLAADVTGLWFAVAPEPRQTRGATDGQWGGSPQREASDWLWLYMQVYALSCAFWDERIAVVGLLFRCLMKVMQPTERKSSQQHIRPLLMNRDVGIHGPTKHFFSRQLDFVQDVSNFLPNGRLLGGSFQHATLLALWRRASNDRACAIGDARAVR